ncbi:hypothetical protein RDABS01_034647 [Bienertia sinuspersici]
MPITSPKSVASSESGTTINNKGGHCLCSPTTHQGSFRCRFHRSNSSTWMMKRSNSMPVNRTTKSATATTAASDDDHTCNNNSNFVSLSSQSIKS